MQSNHQQASLLHFFYLFLLKVNSQHYFAIENIYYILRVGCKKLRYIYEIDLCLESFMHYKYANEIPYFIFNELIKLQEPSFLEYLKTAFVLRISGIGLFVNATNKNGSQY